jgi:hypothetical protein
MLSVIGLTVFAYTIALDLLTLMVDLVLAARGAGTITQFVTAPGHELVMAAVIAVQLLGVIGLGVHFLS